MPRRGKGGLVGLRVRMLIWASALANGSARTLLQGKLVGTSSEEAELYATVESLIPAEPQWKVEIRVSNDMELRDAICRAMNLGDADRSDPLLGCLSKPTPAPTPAPTPTSATTLDGRNIAPPSPSPAAAETPTPIQKHYPDYQIVIEADVRLQGIPLPEFTGRVKITGACHLQLYRDNRPCVIFAVDVLCCSCPSAWSGGSTDMCAPCTKGPVNSNTQPMTVAPGGKLWLDHIEICAGRSERDGGNVALAPGDGEVWSALASESLTYLHAADVRFTKGFAANLGGALAVGRGGLAELIRPTFLENYGGSVTANDANAGHDVTVAPHGVVVVQYPTPEVPFIKEEDAVLAGELRPGLLFNRIIPRPPANPPYAPPPPPAPPPPDATTLLNSALSGTDNDTGTVAGGKGSVVGLWEAIGILVGGLMAVALGIFLCCWGANRRSSGHQRFSDDDVSKEDGGPEASSRLQGETPLDSFVLDSRAEVSARERSRKPMEDNTGRLISEKFGKKKVNNEPVALMEVESSIKHGPLSPTINTWTMEPIQALHNLPLPDPDLGYTSVVSLGPGGSAFVMTKKTSSSNLVEDTYGTVAAMEETKANYVRSRSAGEAFSGEQEGDLGRVMGGQNRIVMVFGPDS